MADQKFGTQYTSPTALPAAATAVATTLDAAVVAVAFSASPYVRTFSFSADGGFGTQSSPASPPAGAPKSLAFSPNGAYLAVAHNTAPFLTVYAMAGATIGAKVAGPAVAAPGTGNCVVFSADGAYLALAHPVTPFVSVWRWAGGFGTKLADPAVLPPTAAQLACNAVAFSPDGSAIAVAFNYSAVFEYVFVWNFSDGFGTRYVLPALASNSLGYSDAPLSLAFSMDSKALAIGYPGRFQIFVWAATGFSGEQLTPLGVVGAVNSVRFSQDGTMISLAAAPFDTFYANVALGGWAVGYGVTLQQKAPTPRPAGTSSGSAFVGNYGVVAGHSQSPYISAYRLVPDDDQLRSQYWLPIATMPRPRAYGTAVRSYEKIYLFGGENATGALAQVDIFDPLTGRWASAAPMPAPRSEPCVISTGYIYVFGGRTGTTAHRDAWIYDPFDDTWAEMPPLPTARYGAAVANLGRNFLSNTNDDQILVVIGGALSGGQPTDLVEYWNLVTEQWVTSPDRIPAPNVGLSVTPRYQVNLNLEVVGGRSPPTNIIEDYLGAGNTSTAGGVVRNWRKRPTRFPGAYFNHGINRLLYFGLVYAGSMFDNNIYESFGNGWSRDIWLPKIPVPREACQGETVASYLDGVHSHTYDLLFGGYNGGYLDDVWMWQGYKHAPVMPQRGTITVTWWKNTDNRCVLNMRVPYAFDGVFSRTKTTRQFGPFSRGSVLEFYVQGRQSSIYRTTAHESRYDKATRTWTLKWDYTVWDQLLDGGRGLFVGDGDLNDMVMTITWDPVDAVADTGDVRVIGQSAPVVRTVVPDGATSGNRNRVNAPLSVPIYGTTIAVLQEGLAVKWGYNDIFWQSALAITFEGDRVTGASVAPDYYSNFPAFLAGGTQGYGSVDRVDDTRFIAAGEAEFGTPGFPYESGVRCVVGRVDPKTLGIVYGPVVPMGDFTATEGMGLVTDAESTVGITALSPTLAVVTWNHEKTADSSVRQRMRALRISGMDIEVGPFVDWDVLTGLTFAQGQDFGISAEGICRLSATRGVALKSSLEYEGRMVVFEVDPASLVITVGPIHLPIGGVQVVANNRFANDALGASIVSMDDGVHVVVSSGRYGHTPTGQSISIHPVTGEEIGEGTWSVLIRVDGLVATTIQKIPVREYTYPAVSARLGVSSFVVGGWGLDSMSVVDVDLASETMTLRPSYFRREVTALRATGYAEHPVPIPNSSRVLFPGVWESSVHIIDYGGQGSLVAGQGSLVVDPDAGETRVYERSTT